ncbi:MAG TPA: pilus assembly protein TadG-related protein [Clostridia bacterium]|nr:pilus assembly protein TadG-related protein [Clostridia bacterium]
MKHLNNKKGSSSIILLFMVVGIAGLMTLTADAGLLYLEKSKLQNAVDSAALAAVSVYGDGQEKMLEEAFKYAELNGIPAERLTVEIQEDDNKVTVCSSKSVTLYFAKIFGISDADVAIRASAITGPIVSLKGIRPFGIEEQEFTYGETYTLKNGGGEGNTGNYGALALGGTGACAYRINLINGYDGHMIKIGDEIETETGNMNGATFDGINELLDSDSFVHGEDLSQLEADCPRLIKIPVVDSFSVAGRTTVKVVGFAAFFLDDVVRRSGRTEITGRFVRRISEGEVDESAEGYGLVGVKLVE